MNAIVPASSTSMPFGELERLADAIAKSGMFGMKTKEQALVLMAISQAEGRHPALAARDFDVIQGKPAKKAEAMMRDFVQAGGRVEWHALTDEVADATFTHPQTGSVRIDWNMERARAAGFAGKDNWKKFPRQMLRSRVVSEGVRTVWPLATSGMYEQSEAADVPAFSGQTIDHEPEPPPDRRDKINAEVPVRPPADAATSTPRAPRVTEPRRADPAPPVDPLDLPLGHEWLVALKKALDATGNTADVTTIGGHASVNDALSRDDTPPKVKRQITELLADAYAKHAEATTDAADPDAAGEPELPPVEIAGAKYVGAG